MTPWMRKLHKWVGLVIAAQFVITLGSGLTMNLLDHDTVGGHDHRAPAVPTPAWPAHAISPAAVLAGAGRPVEAIETRWLGRLPVYRLSHKGEAWLASASDGRPLAVTAADVSAIAAADYVGEGRPSSPELLRDATSEARGHAGMIWRVAFSDSDATTLYVSGRDGSILERRNDTWRVFDIAKMLHFMDYFERDNFNNPLAVMAASGGLWMSLSGIWLLFASFRVGEFVPPRWRSRKELAVFDATGSKLRSVESRSGDTVYVALGRNGLHLPSSCGGGQSCGLCEVRVLGSAPAPTRADREHLTEGRLELGYRLACNLPVRADGQIEVAGGSALWIRRVAKVASVTAVTPFLREIVLAPEMDLGPDFQPGAYVQIHVPAYALQQHDIVYPEHHQHDWRALDLPSKLVSKQPARRAYSLSLPVEKAGGHLTLLARFSPGREDKRLLVTGRGSTYLYSLKPGDIVHFSGPFGDFAVKPGSNEKIFIGGGAGMAPLRAMIHSLLDGGATERIHFWYGARNLRETPYAEEMMALAEQYPNFTWHLVLSEEREHGAGLMKGLVHESAHDGLLRDHPDLHMCEFYLCGPPVMLSATRKLLAQLGVSNDSVAFDDFKV